MKKKGFMRVVLALLMSMLLIVSTGCGKSGNGGSSSGKKSGKTATLADMNEIPEDGIITKEQFKTVAGDNKKVQFKGTTDDGITYIWTYDCSKIQNPADQNLKIDFSEKGLDDLKKQANNANDALKMTMYGKGLICVPDLEVQLPGSVAVQFCISCKRAVWKACKDERCCGNSTGEGRECKETG